MVTGLRQQIAQLQNLPQVGAVTTHPVLSGLLQLRAGASYQADTARAAMLLAAGPVAAGAWCAVVGAADWGIEAAHEFGISLKRTVLVPEPRDRLLDVIAGCIDVMPVVVVRTDTTVRAAEAERLAARLRRRGAVLISWGPWPRSDAHLSISDSRWQGIEPDGAGRLRACQVTVRVQRSAGPVRTRDIWLPGPDLRIRAVEPRMNLQAVS